MKLRQVTLRRPGRALELPFDIAGARFNARDELFEYPPLAMIDPVRSCERSAARQTIRVKIRVHEPEE
ncbi:MAG: hypothetical protein KAS72_12010 [Phycisphaerales bacterium]|nr:hypothetical protein [Phycisphaerales bacterium]